MFKKFNYSMAVISLSFALLFVLIEGPALAGPSDYKQSAICFVGDKVIVFTEVDSVSHGEIYTTVYLSRDKSRNQPIIEVPAVLGACMKLRDHAEGGFDFLGKLSEHFTVNSIVIDTQR